MPDAFDCRATAAVLHTGGSLALAGHAANVDDALVLNCKSSGSRSLAVAAGKSLLSRARKQAVPYANFCKQKLAQVRRTRPQVIVGPNYKLRLEQWAERWNAHA